MQSFCDSATSTSNVVIVEDSLNTQTALRYLLDAIGGLQVVAIESTAATAIHWAVQHPGGWDIAIIDLMLEEGDGFEIIRRFASEPERGRIIVFSGYITDVIRRHCFTLGADAVFRKEESAKIAEYIENLAPKEG
jgi:DNA-binding NarL/FixJ family response regulator